MEYDADVAREFVFDDIARERIRQDEKFPDQQLPDGTGGEHSRQTANIAQAQCEDARSANRLTWKDILREEYAEAVAEIDAAKLRAELIQVAATAVQWVEAIDRREGELAKLPG